MNTSPHKSTQAKKAPSSSTKKDTTKSSTSQAPALNVAQPSKKMVVDSEVNINPGESWYRPKPEVQTPSKDSWYRPKPEVLEMPTKYSWLQDGTKPTITRRQAKLVEGTVVRRQPIPEAERNPQAGEYKSTVPVKHEREEKREERGLAKLWAKIKE